MLLSPGTGRWWATQYSWHFFSSNKNHSCFCKARIYSKTHSLIIGFLGNLQNPIHISPDNLQFRKQELLIRKVCFICDNPSARQLRRSRKHIIETESPLNGPYVPFVKKDKAIRVLFYLRRNRDKIGEAIPFKGNAAHEFSDFRPVLHMIDNIRHTAKPSHLLLAAL